MKRIDRITKIRLNHARFVFEPALRLGLSDQRQVTTRSLRNEWFRRAAAELQRFARTKFAPRAVAFCWKRDNVVDEGARIY